MKQRTILSRLLCIVLTAVMLLGLFAGVLPSPVYAATTSQNNIVARADYLYNIKWTAKSTVYGWNGNYVFNAGTSYRIPYGQPINSGYYIGYGVSVDDFVAAAKTAGSVFYTSRSTYYDGGSSSVYFATDCSAFVSWCWGVSRKTTYSIPQVSTYIGMATASNAYSLQLGDCLNSNDVGHVVLVTDLVYSGSTLTKIEITEQTPPQLKRSTYTPSELGAKYGSYYGIYRYYGTVPAAPTSSSGSTDSDVIAPGASSTITTKYYPACPASSAYLYEGMANIGVQMNWDLQCEIAEANGITDFSGTAEQNEAMLALLKAGKLLNPGYVETTPSTPSTPSTPTTKNYYPACDSSCVSLYEGLADIGVSMNWDLQTRIAAANGITDFSGTAEQNNQMLALLKAGQLVDPDNTSTTPSTPTNIHYPACSSSSATLYAGLSDIGVSMNWDLQTRIAAANGITNFSGTAEQNNQMLALLKAGKLVDPDKASSAPSTTTTPSTPTTPSTSNYYDACSSSSTTLHEGMEDIGVNLDWNLQCEIAEANGITDFSGTAEQNNQMLALLKAGKLLKPGYVATNYYAACASSCGNLYEGMADIGVTLDWDLQCSIAKVNGIEDFSGTIEQNTVLLDLLKAGKLIIPGTVTESESTDSGTAGDSVVDGDNGYDRGYAGGKNGTGEYVAFGLDVSSWQGSNLDFKKIKNAGYDFVILRAGTTKGKDTLFETYYTKARAAGLDIGAYYYSYATDTGTAARDAEDMLSYISGKTFEYPIYFDYEDASQQSLSSNTSKQICLTFMDKLAEEGYLVGIYTGSYFSTLLPMSEICKRYEFWVAHYVASGGNGYDGTDDYTVYGPKYSTQSGMYQYTDSVWIGNYGPYDGDVCYKDYPSIVKKYGFNGYAPAHTHSYKGTVTTKATCVADGDKTYKCAGCGDSYTEKIPSTGHNYKAVVTESTCSKAGKTVYTCSKCSDSYTETIPVLDHSYETVVTAPTCTADGYTTYTCSTCSDSYTDNATSSTGHSYTATITKQPTCSEAGAKTYTCSGCGNSYTEGVSSTGHSYSTVVTEPTCSNAGFTTHTCSTCGSSYTSDRTSTVDHNYVNGKCFWCGAAEPVTQLDYYLIGYINGADYGCEGDSQNMGEYKFVDGKLTVTFQQDSYVFIKTTNNTNWYMTDGWLGMETTTATLYNTALNIEHNKFFVPGGVEVTFTLVVNEDDTLTLSYTVPTVEIPKFNIAFSQIDMGNALGMNFAFPKVDGIDFTGAYAKATMAGNAQTIPADKWTTATIGGKTHYVFGYSNIAAKQMADEVSIVIYNAKGEAISNEYVDSIQSYVMRNVDKKDAESKALMVDMLNYGAAAQVYYGYNTEDLANAKLSETQKAYGTATKPAVTDIRVKGANYLGTRLELGSSIGMQMNFVGTTANMYAVIEFTNHSGVKVSERVAPTLISGSYLIVIDQIVVADGRMPVTVTVYNADGTVYGSATDSMASYIARMSNADSLYENIMKFSDSARAYLH